MLAEQLRHNNNRLALFFHLKNIPACHVPQLLADTLTYCGALQFGGAE